MNTVSDWQPAPSPAARMLPPPHPARSPPPAASHRHLAAEEEFEELCFEYGIELDDVVRRRRRRCPPTACPRADRLRMLLLQLSLAHDLPLHASVTCRPARRRCCARSWPTPMWMSAAPARRCAHPAWLVFLLLMPCTLSGAVATAAALVAMSLLH